MCMEHFWMVRPNFQHRPAVLIAAGQLFCVCTAETGGGGPPLWPSKG